MKVRITAVQIKDITTKAGQAMRLRIVQGLNEAGEVFKYTLPRQHVDVRVGDAIVRTEPYIGFDADLGARAQLVQPEPK